MNELRTFVAPLLTSVGTPLVTPGNEPVTWLDRFLQGGLRRPESVRPLKVLLSGRPGSGKSILAQQIAYNQAAYFLEHGPSDRGPSKAEDATSVYITTETSGRAILDNMAQLGWPPDVENGRSDLKGYYAYDLLDGNETLQNAPAFAGRTPLMLVVSSQTFDRPFKEKDPSDWMFKDILAQWQKLIGGIIRANAPRLVIIDSLNILETAHDRAALFTKLISHLTGESKQSKPDFLVMVLDTPTESDTREATQWEYISDVCIRLDQEPVKDDYMSRTLQVVKTRFQPNAMGRQRAKILPRPESGFSCWLPKAGRRIVAATQEDLEREASRLREKANDIRNTPAFDPEGPRPITNRGGFFAFPSLHFVLSQVRTRRRLILAPQYPRPSPAKGPAPDYAKDPAQPACWGPGVLADESGLNWPVSWGFELVGSAVPRNRCTAIVGRRGARKSNFAFQFLLDGIANGERGMLISFRDDPDAIAAMLRTIRRAAQYKKLEELAPDSLIVLHQRPGYVTPEELLHRVITAVGEYGPSRAVLCAVDQWDAAHPLLAESSLLIPTLIDFLNVHEVTSMIVGVEDDSRSLASYGLTAKADVVLQFQYRTLRWPTQKDSLITRQSLGPEIDSFPTGVPLLTHPANGEAAKEFAEHPKVVVRAIRVPAAAAGFGRAALEYEYDELAAGTAAPAGLKLIPLAPEFEEGTEI